MDSVITMARAPGLYPLDEVVVRRHAVADPSLGPNNRDRALFVAPLVEAFHAFYYGGPGEAIATVMADLIGDLGHLFDRLDPDEREDHPTFWSVLERAHMFYEDEFDEEVEYGAPTDG